MFTYIRGLLGTPTFDLSVVVQRHADTGNGFYTRCGNRFPCAANRHARSVTAAAGEDPRRYHPQTPSPPAGRATVSGQPGRWKSDAAVDHAPNYVGHRVRATGRTPLDQGALDYERDT